jgi:hypothetical protein
MPSYKSVEEIRGIASAVITRISRNPELLTKKGENNSKSQVENHKTNESKNNTIPKSSFLSNITAVPLLRHDIFATGSISLSWSEN